MNKLGARFAALVLMIGAVAPATAQLLPPPPGGSLIVTLTSPGQGSTVQGTIAVNASVSIVGSLTVSRVDFFADGNLIGADSAAPYSISWDTRKTGNGSHTLTAVAQDSLGVRWTSNAVSVTVANDITRPTVTINQAAGQADPASASPINFTVVFSEPVSGFTGADVTIGGTAGGTKTVTVTGGPSTYNAAVSGMTTAGTVIATIGAGLAADAANNTNTASISTDNNVAWTPPDTTAPTVTINQAAGQADPASASPINFTIVFSEPVSGFTGAGVTIGGTAGGTRTVTVTGGPSTYNATVSGMTDGTVTAIIVAGVAQDAAGNANTASTSTDNTVTFKAPDGTAPTVTINQAAGQADPSSDSAINFTVVFSEPVNGFTGADVTIGGTAGGTKTVTVTGGPSTYNATVSGMTEGTVIATIGAGVAQDAAGNANSASTSTDNTVTFRTGAPPTGGGGTRFEEDTPAISASPTGAWVRRGPEVASFSGGTAGSSDVTGATVTFTFTGTAVSWIGLRCSACGIATVSIDGGAASSIDTAGPAAPGTPGLASEALFTAANLTAGSHTMVITVTGSTTSGGAHIIVDAFDVSGGTGSAVNRVEENDPAVSVTGAWVLRGTETAAFSGGAAGSSNAAGATATVTFSGTAVSWIGLRCSVCGIATVSIDGGEANSVDTAGSSAPGSPGLASEPVFTVSGLAAGSHTMVIAVSGGTTSGGAHIVIDALDVTP